MKLITLVSILTATVSFGAELELELTAAKDSFGRSYTRNANRGRSEYLMIAPTPGVRSIIGFDLSSVTNEIVAAELSFCIRESAKKSLSFTVAQMIYTAENSAWVEGSGLVALSQGQSNKDIQIGEAADKRPASLGESTFQWLAFRDQPWLDQNGKPVVNLMDGKLWQSPVSYTVDAAEWTAERWFSCPIKDVKLLEEIREEDHPMATFGLWGKTGKGIYTIHAKESGQAPKLLLTVKVEDPVEKEAVQ